MSSGGSQVAVLGMRGALLPEGRAGITAEHPQVVRLIAFAALGLYGITRWSRLVGGGMHGRLVAILALALLLAGGRAPIARRSRIMAALFTVVILLAAFAIAGVPLHWILHLRIAIIANAISGGISTLPQTLVPYLGTDQWVRLDIILGATVLLFDAALLLAFAPRAMDDLRRAGAALPLLALVAVPSALVHPHYPYLNGLLLFLMLAAFILADRISAAQAPSALGLCLIAAIVAMLMAPGLDRHSFWLNPETLAGAAAPTPVEVFDWTQNYGPAPWPHGSHTVLEVQASRPDYWKAEDLDVFDMRGWMQGLVEGQENAPQPSSAALAKWSQTIQVTVRDMRTEDVIGAGVSGQPTHIPQSIPGSGAGTWTTVSPLRPGDSYSVRAYTPRPTPAQLNAAGADYAGLPAGYRTIIVPSPVGAGRPPSVQIVFPTFHSGAEVENVIGLPVSRGASVVRSSPYGPAYALAQRLARGATTPYAFARSIEALLAHGYTYTQDPPVRAYPLESFLFKDKRGYCQQFAGAMALLLRMGGVPARVAVGFTEGHQDPASGHWLVTDEDAHAWVEAWFPRYGWVAFDPTPPVDPALRNLAPVTTASSTPSAVRGSENTPIGAAKLSSRKRRAKGRARHSRAGASAWEGWLAGSSLLLAALVLLWLSARPLSSTEDLVAELERALARIGRRLAPEDTLAGVEASLRGSPTASQYVSALRMARFGGGDQPPTTPQRRALRRQLGCGSGPLGRLRALWALPPRRRHRATGAGVHRGA